MLKSIPNIINKNVILGGDFNLFLNTSLKTQGGNSIFKKKSLAKFIETKETLDLCVYEELGSLNQSDLLSIKTTFLVVFKEDWIPF